MVFTTSGVKSDKISALQKARLAYQPVLPLPLRGSLLKKLVCIPKEAPSVKVLEDIRQLFPCTADQQVLQFHQNVNALKTHTPLTVGVVLSGGQAPGGHNVITGLYDALTTLNSASTLIGFCDGPKGIIDKKFKYLNRDFLNLYRNQGGFDLIGSGRTKIETPEQFRAAKETVETLKLDGLVIIGGDDSNTNAALLAEYFKANELNCSVIGVPKTIDGDLKNAFIEVSFGFDTAAKIYSEIIGNLLCDGLSAKKYYFFIKMMGRSASHITLECALQTHPNMALISEEIQQQAKTLHDITNDICDMICARAAIGKDYGGILIPEGIIEFVPEFKKLISSLNNLLAMNGPHATVVDGLPQGQPRVDYISKLLNDEEAHCFVDLPDEIKFQLLLDRDPHGNIQVSKIETERLFIHMVAEELKKRQADGRYVGKFNAQPHFCGYEGRSGMPTNFDSQYCYALGHVAALLVNNRSTGYMCCIKNLAGPVLEWEIGAVPLVQMMHMELRNNKRKPVIRKALVDLEAKPFQSFKEARSHWALDDDYRYPGPIQFFGPAEVSETRSLTLETVQSLEQGPLTNNKDHML